MASILDFLNLPEDDEQARADRARLSALAARVVPAVASAAVSPATTVLGAFGGSLRRPLRAVGLPTLPTPASPLAQTAPAPTTVAPAEPVAPSPNRAFLESLDPRVFPTVTAAAAAPSRAVGGARQPARPSPQPVLSATDPNILPTSPEGLAAFREERGVVDIIRPGGARSFLVDGREIAAPSLELAVSQLGREQQQQADLTSALRKPVGAPLTVGEASAIDAQAARLQEQVGKSVSEERQQQIAAGATLGAARTQAARFIPETAALEEYLAPETTPERRAVLQPLFGGRGATQDVNALDATTKAITSMINSAVDPVTKQAMSDLSALADSRGLTGARKLEFVRDNADEAARIKRGER